MIVLRRRRVRIHQNDPAPTVQGILASSFGDHYRLLKAEILAADGTVELEGEAWIPREKVILVETIRT